MHRGQRERKQFYSQLNIKPECDTHHRQSDKEIVKAAGNLSPLYR